MLINKLASGLLTRNAKTRSGSSSAASLLLHRHILSKNFSSIPLFSHNKVTASREFLLQPRLFGGPILGRFSFSTSASPEPKEKESGQPSHRREGSDYDLEKLSKDDLVKLFKEKENLLKIKEEAIKTLKDGMGEVRWEEVSEYDMVKRLREVQGLLKTSDKEIEYLENLRLMNLLLFAGIFFSPSAFRR